MPASPASHRRARRAPAADTASLWPAVGDAAIAVLHGIGEVSALNGRVAHELHERRLAGARKLAQARDPVELFSAQAEMVRGDLEQGLRYWGELASAAGELQSELAACGMHLVNTEDLFAGLRVLRAP